MLPLFVELVGCPHPASPPAFERSSRPGAGGVVGVTVLAGTPAEAVNATFDSLAAAEAAMSEWVPGSLTAKLARGEAVVFEHQALALFQEVDLARTASEGAFDVCWKGGAVVISGNIVTAPDCTDLDLGGVLKGWLADRMAEAILAAGIANFVVDVGGDLVAQGSAGDGGPGWPVVVVVAGSAVRVRLVDQALSSASDDQQAGHIVDARSGRPQRALRGVWVTAPTGLQADAWDTATFAAGRLLPLPDGVVAHVY